MDRCEHQAVECLNPYDPIRKYRCLDCGEVMMCDCDEDVGRAVLPHQLEFGSELETQQRVKVTLGFQPRVCRECRGLGPIAHPKAEIYRATSKIRRYYWREIFMETSRRFMDWASASGYSDLQLARRENNERYEEIEAEALECIKRLHKEGPKYEYKEKSQSQVISEHDVDVVDLKGTYTHAENGSLAIERGGNVISPEKFVMRFLEEQGYTSIFVESTPFHILFGVLMWPLIQDPADPKLQLRSFGQRDVTATGRQGFINTLLPSDFGAPGYFTRRKPAIEKHLKALPHERDQLLRLFNDWLPQSEDLRQYLWAHESEKIQVARRILAILSPTEIVSILEYLAADYWRRYVGWPDLLAFTDDEHMFVEVKSTKDKLSEDQKRWIEDNSTHLHFPFKLVKIHKMYGSKT